MKTRPHPSPLLIGEGTERNKAFTLVELIVVITILAILATIAFLSFQNISSSARDSSRLSDVTNIKKSLELTNATNGGFPMPDSSTGITRSGSVAWYQGTLGDTAVQQLKKLSKAPLDPLLKSPYTYSVTNSLKEYQIGYALENSVSYKDHPQSLLSKEGSNSVPLLAKEGLGVVFADTSSLLGYTDGNYNGLMIKVSTGSLDYYLAVPSIISSDLTSTGKTNLVNQTGSLVFRGKKSLPANTAKAFFGTNKTDSSVSFNPKSTGDFVIYSGTAGLAPDTNLFMSGIKLIYTGSTLSNLGDTNLTNSVNTLTSNTNTLASVLGKVGTAVSVNSTISNSCNTQPSYVGATFTIGNPISVNQTWQGTSSTGACYYTCGVGKVLVGNNCVSETCDGTTPDGTAKVSNATSTIGGTWNYSTTPGICTYKCNTNYHTENSGLSCISNTKSCTIVNGTGQQTWNGSSWGTCTVLSCNPNYIQSGNSCITPSFYSFTPNSGNISYYSASEHYGDPWRFFVINSGGHMNCGGAGSNILLTFNSAKYINSFSFQAGSNYRNWHYWRTTLYGSTDNSNWVNLGYVDVNVGDEQYRSYTINSNNKTTKFQYIKLYLSNESTAGGSSCHISDSGVFSIAD